MDDRRVSTDNSAISSPGVKRVLISTDERRKSGGKRVRIVELRALPVANARQDEPESAAGKHRSLDGGEGAPRVARRLLNQD